MSNNPWHPAVSFYEEFDEHRNDLLFGMVAFQSGAVEADQLAETCAEWAGKSVLLADRLVDRGCLTIEQKSQIEDSRRGATEGRTEVTPRRPWQPPSTAGFWM